MGLEILRRSLGARIITIASLIVVAAFLTLFIVNSLSQKSSVLQEVRAGAERASDLIMKMIEDPMTTGNDEGTRHKFQVLAEEYKDLRVFLTDFKGASTYSTVAEAEKKDLAGLYDNEDFKALLARSLKEKTTAGNLLKIQGEQTFTEVKSVLNDPQCHHCHGASQPILGSLVIIKNIEPQLTSLLFAQIRGAVISFFGLAGVLFFLAMFMRKSVIHRVKAIATTTGLVSKGNLDVRFDATGEDEISNLGSHLSEMVQQIKNQIEYNRGVLAGIIVPLFVLDNQGKVTFINKAFTEILNQDAAAIQGKPLLGLGEIDQATERSIKEGVSLSGLSHFQRSDEITFPLHYEIAPLKDAHNATIGAICVMIDLTQEEHDRKQIETQQANLLRVADQVTEVALQFKEAAQILSTEMDRLAQGMDDTANQTSQVAAAIEEMNGSVLEIAKNAGDTADSATESKKSAIVGSQEVKEAMDVTNVVVSKADALAGTLNLLAQRSDNIGKVMSIINDIADQTNLLALNAAIEAARAGDAGRGFAVVADEVRKLAEKTMSATKEVETAVGHIQSGMKDAVSGMSDTREQLGNALSMSGKADAELKGIVNGFIKITDMVNNIAVASEEQSAANEEINKSIGAINTLSQDISQGLKLANSKISDVAEMSRSLVSLVANFKQVQETDKAKYHQERRRYSRVNLAAMDHGIACYAIGAGRSEKIPAELMDISQGGVKLHFNDRRAPFSVKDSVRILTQLPKGSVDLGELTGKICWIHGPEVGIEFDKTLTITESELQRLIAPK